MIFWPCILKLEGDDELIYLSSEQFFNEECTELILSDDDYVIDSTGYCYLIEMITDKPVLAKTERVVVVEEVTHLIRAHEFNKAELCLTKIHFLTVSDAINSLINLN
ncbi:DUF4144 family protein [Colwellia sp. Bg11-12]|jgi:hypothetical protein|uniref:DUF4144 family protein n=1 Tax=Colwellia sp. Bg11-12 TaxID=2759817 RepID=UPI0015F39774|nr:DUF4144 family protein [Colwellia sp. Bg11-12]MBA6265465.1 DUF4144 domain-containing protein [Colwellia sp. Bg11-12]